MILLDFWSGTPQFITVLFLLAIMIAIIVGAVFALAIGLGAILGVIATICPPLKPYLDKMMAYFGINSRD